MLGLQVAQTAGLCQHTRIYMHWFNMLALLKKALLNIEGRVSQLINLAGGK